MGGSLESYGRNCVLTVFWKQQEMNNGVAYLRFSGGGIHCKRIKSSSLLKLRSKNRKGDQMVIVVTNRAEWKSN